MKERRDNADIIQAVQEAVRITVNGKIDKLHTEVLSVKQSQEIIISDVKDLKVKMEELTPVRTSISTFKNIKQGATFIAGFITPFAVVGGVAWAVFKLAVIIASK